MTPRTVKVKGPVGTYYLGGKKYHLTGEAQSIPEELAAALGLMEYDPDAVAGAGGTVDTDVTVQENTDAVKANTATLQQASVPKSPEKSDSTPLVDGLQHADLLTAAGITSMEALEAGLSVPEGGKQSAVEAVDGIGKKTVEAYTKAVADWRKGQAAQ